MNHALRACGYPSWSFKRVREQLDQWELKNNLKINKKDSKDKRTKIRVSALCQDCFSSPELGLPLPWGGNIDEIPHDIQDDAGTSQGQTYTTGKCGCSVPARSHVRIVYVSTQGRQREGMG